MAFYDYREPIEYVVDRYFEKKRFLSSNSVIVLDGVSMSGCGVPDDSLPDIPCKIIRDADGRAYKFIYGDTEALLLNDEASPVIWQQELVRNALKQVEKIIVTYPDGETVTEELVRDANGKVNEYKLE